jgi:hypothetical protein
MTKRKQHKSEFKAEDQIESPRSTISSSRAGQ